MPPRFPSRTLCSVALVALGPGLAAQSCPVAPELPANCELLGPGTPLPYPNAAAPDLLDLPPGGTVQLYVLGHSESYNYDTFLQPMLDNVPLVPGVEFEVINLFIGGHEAWQWASPGQQGYQTIEDILATASRPFLALCLFSNNQTFPVGAPDPSDPGYARLLDDLEAIADHLYDGGQGAERVYLSAHRYHPINFLPSWYENCAIGGLMERAELAGKGYLKPGPAQHDLHWCCFPDCYAFDQAHTNPAGDFLMARTWYRFLEREVSGFGRNCLGGENSTGNQALLTADGSGSVSANDLVLQVTDAVPGQFGIFFYGAGIEHIPFGGGVLCSANPRVRLDPPLVLGPGGSAGLAVDLATLPPPGLPGAVVPGSTWNFQNWYRDPLGAGFNTSSAVDVLFRP